MAVKVQRHLQKIKAAHDRHKKKVLTAFHKIRKHPGCYKPGFKPSRAAVPKSMPKMPKNLNARGAGLWGWVKNRWTDVKKLFNAHKHKILEEGKKLASAYVKKQGARVRDYAVGRARDVAQRVHSRAETHVRNYVKRGEDKVRQIGNKVDNTINKYLPKGSGWVSATLNRGRRVAPRYGQTRQAQGSRSKNLSRFGQAVAGWGSRMIGGLARNVSRAVRSRVARRKNN